MNLPLAAAPIFGHGWLIKTRQTDNAGLDPDPGFALGTNVTAARDGADFGNGIVKGMVRPRAAKRRGRPGKHRGERGGGPAAPAGITGLL